MLSSRHNFWRQLPFIRIVLPFITGIIGGIYLPVATNFLLPCTLALFLFSIIPFFLSYHLIFRLRYTIAIALQLLIMATGAQLTLHYDPRLAPAWIGHQDHSQVVVVTRERPQEKSHSWKIASAIKFAGNGHSLPPCTGNLFVYLNKKHPLPEIPPGSTLLIKQPAIRIRESGNPDAFDYSRYALFRGFTHQLFTDTGYRMLNAGPHISMQSFLDVIRDRLLEVIRRYIPGSSQQGLAAALLLGYKDDLDPELVRSYSATGVVHIIAISGLHLGLIYMILMLLFRPMRRSNFGKVMSAVFILCFLWMFTLLTGAQPSILRSAVMFSSLIVADIFSRRSSPYNSLAASAFVLLCINPYWILDAGFQLSYAALLGIMLFMKPIYQLWFIKNKLLDLAWQMNAVTLSAQVLTVPLTTFYFRQFPTLFIVSNFLAVPLSSIILIGEILLCLCSVVPLFAIFTGKVTAMLINTLNAYIGGTEALPFSSWQRLSITLPQAWLLCFMMLALCGWLLFSRKKLLLLLLLAAFIFIVLRSHSFYICDRREMFIVYHVNRSSAAVFVSGRRWFYKGDISALQEPAYSFNMMPHHIAARLERRPSKMIIGSNNFLYWCDKSFLMVNEDLYLERSVRLDVLLISGNKIRDPASLLQLSKPRQVVLDGTVAPWQIKKIRAVFQQSGVPVHVVSEMGAFVMYPR